MATNPPETPDTGGTIDTQDIVVTAPATGAPTQLTARQLMSLGMFVFGMDTAAYSEFTRSVSWNHATVERHMARPATQFTGPGEDSVQLAGLLVPEIAGEFGALAQLEAMGSTGDAWPLMDGMGRVLGVFRIARIDSTLRSIMAGGLPRAVDFGIDLVRVD